MNYFPNPSEKKNVKHPYKIETRSAVQLHPFLSTMLDTNIPNPLVKIFSMKIISPKVSFASTADPGMQETSLMLNVPYSLVYLDQS
jgi:hypothetical protein